MGRKRIQFYQHVGRNVWIGRYHDLGKEVVLCSVEECKAHSGRSEQRKLDYLENLYQQKRPEQPHPEDASVTAYLVHLASYNHPKTISEYRFVLTKLSTFHQLSVDQYVQQERSRGIRDTTINSRIRAINAYLSWKEEVTGQAQKRIKKLTITKKGRVPAFSQVEIQQIESYLDQQYQAAPSRWKARWHYLRFAHDLMLHSGLRASEALHLQWEDINLIDYTMTIGDLGNHKVKGRVETTLPIRNPLKPILSAYKKLASTNLCLGAHWGDTGSLDHAFQQIHKHLNIINRKSTHSYRATYCTHLIQAGLPITVVRDFLRHKDISTTEMYVDPRQISLKAYI